MSAPKAKARKSASSLRAPKITTSSKPNSSGPTPPYLFVFLRAVNLGRHNKVPMKRLMELLAQRDFPPAAYLLASGNLVFGPSAGGHAALASDLERLIADEFAVDTAVIYRTTKQLQEAVDANPFTVPAGGSVHLAMWNVDVEVPEKAQADLEALDAGDDILAIVGSAAYMSYAATSHTSKLSNQLLQRRLTVRSTARNLNTLLRLLERWPAA